jgi:hypothetical protein
MFPHLPEMRQAGDSVQVAKENQQQRSRVVRQANLVAVWVEKRQVSHWIAYLDGHG